MATPPFHLRRLILISGFVIAAAAAPVAGLFAAPDAGAPLAQCASGEEPDVYTTTCTPFLVPTSPQGFTSTAANPDIPEIDGVPCVGASAGACIGLAEDNAAMGPQPIPRSTISSSP